jgi:hypothetical protein
LLHLPPHWVFIEGLQVGRGDVHSLSQINAAAIQQPSRHVLR